MDIQRIGKLFVLECETLEVAHFGGEAGQHEDVPVDGSIWHARFGHISTKRMKNIRNYVTGQYKEKIRYGLGRVRKL